MKNITSLVFAGIIGGLITLGGHQLMQEEAPIQQPVAKQVSTTITTPSSKPVPLNFTEAATIAMPTVVHIKASESKGQAQYRRDERQENGGNMLDFFFDSPFGGGGSPFGGGQKKGTGSGVIISTDGYIVKIDSDNLPTMAFANSDKAQVGEWVLAVGNPFDLTSTVTAGIISAKGRSIGVIKNSQAIENFIQTDAVVNPGNSGGALVDLDGNLVGINTAIATPTGTFAGYSFAIPSNMVMDITNHIIEHGGPRAMLGVQVVDVDVDFAAEQNLSVDSGVYIAELTDGGAAQYAGVLPNDVIIRVDGVKVADAPTLIDIVSKAKVGETLELTINRDGRTKKIPVTLKEETCLKLVFRFVLMRLSLIRDRLFLCPFSPSSFQSNLAKFYRFK